LKHVVHAVSSDTTTAASDRSALAAQEKQTAGRRGGGRADVEGREGYIDGCFCGHDERSSRRTRRWLCGLLLLLQKASPYEVSVPLLKEKPMRGTHISITLSDDEQLRRRFKQFQMFQEQQNTHVQSSSFFVTLAQTGTLLSCLTSSISHT